MPGLLLAYNRSGRLRSASMPLPRWILICALGSRAAAHGQDVLNDADPCRADGIVRPYAPVREADVTWARRVWRVIDLRDARNAAISAPQGLKQACRNLMGVIRHGLKDEGGIAAYDPGPEGKDDAFRARMSSAGLKPILASLDTLGAEAIGRWIIKEDWILDGQRGVMEARIIGLAPMIEVRGEDGELRGYRPLFWLYYPECRQLFSWWTASLESDGERLSYEALFDQRRFFGEITKVSSVLDRSINATSTGIEALLESDAQRQQLLDVGFDWHY